MLHAPGIGPVRCADLLDRFGSAQAILDAAAGRELEQVGIPATARAYLKNPDWNQIERELRWLERPNSHLVTLLDPAYPALLRAIAQAPLLLFVQGDCTVLSDPQIAIVGTRNPTPPGRQAARAFATHLAQAGLTITSGLAQGIDAEAHAGALAADAITIAVMATGLDRVYPAKNRDLAHAIAERGALVSEFVPGTPALAEHFPRRNRIISGLSIGVLVIEAALKSGSLITAQLALEQGREVFAMPGSIHNPLAKGCHNLIRQGAKLVETGLDILEELGPLVQVALAAETGQGAATKTSNTGSNAPESETNLDSDYRALLDCFGAQAVAVDELVERCGLTADVVSSMLLILELQGHVTTAPGGFYRRLAVAKR